MEFYIRRVLIEGLFEEDNDYRIELTEGCNCIYGGNGAGKTTIINLMVNCLNAEVERLSKTAFLNITISLAKSKQVKLIKFLSVARHSDPSGTTITYNFEGQEPVIFFTSSRSRHPEAINETAESLKRQILEKINLTHVPLLRIHDSELFGMRDDRDEFLHSFLRNRNLTSAQINEILDPSSRVLSSLQRQFTAEANEARKLITTKLETLKSNIIEKIMIDGDLAKRSSTAYEHVSKAITKKPEDIDVSTYIKKFQDAQINIPEGKIREHFLTWKKLNDEARENYAEMIRLRPGSGKKQTAEEAGNYQKIITQFNSAYFSLIAMTTFHDRFLSITQDVESMQSEKVELTKSFRDYQAEVNSYFKPRKSFGINEDGLFKIQSKKRTVELSDLSSGEKHILTILGKAALSRRDGAVFIADEPELSLHLDWQRMILPSIIRLSPKSQIIVATHSPAIIAKGATEIDLEECR